MDRLTLLLLVVPLSACSAPGFTVTLTNNDTSALYMDQRGTGGLLTLSEMRSDGEAEVSFNQYTWCAPVCGSPTSFGCAGMEPAFVSAFALLPGDSTTLDFEGGAAWYLSSGYEGQCIRRTALRNPIRVTVCSDDELQSLDGEQLSEPDVSGPVESDTGSVVVAATCEQFEFELAESTDLQVSLE